MYEIIKKIASQLDFINFRHPGQSISDLPYVNYEYNSVSFYNQQQVLFTLDVTADNADDAEMLSTRVRKKLNEYRFDNAEAGFKITDTPALATVISNQEGYHIRRLNFTIIAYFEELQLYKYVTNDNFIYVTSDDFIYVWR